MLHLWVQFAVSNLLFALQVAIQDPKVAAEIKQSAFDVYYAIQRTYPELSAPKGTV